MTRSDRRLLTQALSDVLLPRFMEAGFVQLPLDDADARSPEIRAAFPFGRLRRPVEGGFQQVEIQLDKNKRPAFRINFGFVPGDGIRHAVADVKPEDAWVHYLSRYHELYQSRVFRRWFAVRDSAGGAPAESDYRALAEAAAALIPEIEDAFAERRAAPWATHVRRVEA